MWIFKHHEFWPGRIFELPGYFYLTFWCLRYGVGPRGLLKVNPAFDHAGFSFASKHSMQQAVLPSWHPRTHHLPATLSDQEKVEQLKAFAAQVGWPLIIKPDCGLVGKGLGKLRNQQEVKDCVPILQTDYMAQQYIDLPLEFGIFVVRLKGEIMVTAINQKHFPTIIGDGQSSILQLAKAHPRYTHYWHLWLQSIDTSEVLPKGQKRQISYVGSHTMGCKFTNDDHLITPALQTRFAQIFAEQDGFHYGRLDVRCQTEKDLETGDFSIIEINGVDSLPTNMFDPRETIWQSYRILLRHFKLLAQVAREQKHVDVPLMSSWQIIKRVWQAGKTINQQHNLLERHEAKH